ncbi:DUF7521 family protein [Halosegnis longus]
MQIDLTSLPTQYFVLFVTFGIVIALGLFIVYQAYQGYRRNGNRRMVFLAIGLALITVASPLIAAFVALFGLPFGSDGDIYQFYMPLITSILDILGVGCILYSLSIRGES